jgi:hypothetical protein
VPTHIAANSIGGQFYSNLQSQKRQTPQSVMRVISWILAGYGFAILFVALMSFSDYSISKARLAEIVAKADQEGSLNWRHYPGEDYFTECSLITMELLQPASALKNAVDTNFAHDFRYHPCDVLKFEVLGGGPSDLNMAIASYQSYPFGTRHLAGLLFNFMDLKHLRWLYLALSYLSIMALAAAALVRQPRKPALVVSAITLSLLLASSLQSHGHNIGHAPSYIAGFSALAVFIGFPQTFRQPAYRWGFFGALGIVLAYFDMFCGATPIVLAFTIVFDRIFYSADKPFFSALRRAVGIATVMAAAFVLLTGVRLTILYLVYGLDGSAALSGLLLRASHEAGGHVITYGEIFSEMWTRRDTLAPGFIAAALFFASIAAWIAATWKQPSTDLAVFGLAALGCLSWIFLFPNHAYVHPGMDVRLFAAPIALGFGALVMVLPTISGPWRAPTNVVSTCKKL